MEELIALDEKICDLLRSENPIDVQIGKDLVFSRHNFPDFYTPMCMGYLVCNAISSFYKALHFEINSQRGGNWSIKMTMWESLNFINIQWNELPSIRVEKVIFRLIEDFKVIRKKKSFTAINRWVDHEIKRDFIRVLPSLLEGVGYGKRTFKPLITKDTDPPF